MKKKPLKYQKPAMASLPALMQEPEVAYLIDTTRFSVSGFTTLQARLGFSQQEWAAILHISERTLQRYLKDEDKSFGGLQAELLHCLKKLADTGQQLFTTPESFVLWLRQPKQVLGQQLSFKSLQSISGIQLLQQELGRMAYGVYI